MDESVIRNVAYFGYVPASMAQLDARSTGDQEVAGFRQLSFVKIDHETFSMVILTLPLIQERKFLAKGCTQYWLTA